jgi:hypothetical protein
MALAMRYLRNKVDGFIYEWHPILAKNAKLEEITEQEAFPERFIPAPARGRKSAVSLTTDDVPEPPPVVNEELGREAGRTKRR